MTDQIKAIIHQYWKKEIDRNEFVKKIQAEIGGKKEDFRDLFQQIIHFFINCFKLAVNCYNSIERRDTCSVNYQILREYEIEVNI